MIKCIVMFSGGLDSTIAVHRLKDLGFDVLALHFVLPFYSGLGRAHRSIGEAAQRLGVPLRIEEEGAEFLDMYKHTRFGFGKYANPCRDCRIHRLTKAKKIMEETGAQFIATGEVLGQRPMSQLFNTLNLIEKKAGLLGLLVRPLSGQHLRPTVPEEKGWIKREDLFDFWGRGRKPQFAYARKFGLRHLPPAGGCLLTMPQIVYRLDDLQKHKPEYDIDDFRLLAYGRWFRLSPDFLLVVGRDEADNDALEKMALSGDVRMNLANMMGPTGLGRGTADETLLDLAGSIVARYSKARKEARAEIAVVKDGEQRVIVVSPVKEENTEKYRVKTE